MQDIIFGALISDELKLVHHRSGLQHNYAIEPLNPKPDQPVAIFALVGADINLDEVVCYYTLDGGQPVASNRTGAERLDRVKQLGLNLARP